MTIPPQQTRVVETHSSVLLFLADHVLKFRKPVDLGFLDFRGREARAAAVAEEVRLNRRIAPDVYLAGAEVAGEGTSFEPVVVMRRLPGRLRLAELLRASPDDGTFADELRRLARLLAAFHARCPTSPEIASAAAPERLTTLWNDNVAGMRPFCPVLLDPHRIDVVARLATRYLAGRGPLLERRMEHGLVRDGHGDLLADDIFLLPDGPRVLDCLDFDPALRHGDVLGDAAFLAMDLERLGHPRAAHLFLAAYAEFGGEHHPRSLEHFYVAYRAAVRTKVTCLRFGQTLPGHPDREQLARSAEHLLDLCVRHLQAADVTLLLLGGLPGTGKSTVAAGVSAGDADRDWTVLSSDVVRKELVGLRSTSSARASFGEGLYAPHMTRASYLELFRRAETALTMGENVIIDASFIDEAQRSAARAMAARAHARVVEVMCEVPADVVERRLAARSRTVTVSDADRDVYELMRHHADPWPTAACLDTGDAAPLVVERALRLVGVDGAGAADPVNAAGFHVAG